MAKRKLTRRQDWRIKKIQEERTARADKKEDGIQSQLTEGELGQEQHGLVICHFGMQVDVEVLEGDTRGTIHRCNLRANLGSLVTGDKVIWRSGTKNTGVVVAVLDRHTVLSRPNMHGDIRPVAANIDYIVIVVAPEPQAFANLIDRYLVASEVCGIEPVLLLNKTDLINDENREHFTSLLATYDKIGYRTLSASVYNSDDGLDELKGLLNGRISVFVGQSGVGKSSIIQALLPEEELKVGELSISTGKGKHTTTAAKLFHFPGGGDLIDSPGIREFGLWHMDQLEVLSGFKEFQEFVGYCRFRDCHHEREPGCALLKAVEDGHISETRMNSYKRIIDSLDEGKW
jgi:ribosome biogenesis GTPase